MMEFKGLNLLRARGAAKDKIFCGPEKLFLDINTTCNLNCIYCWDHSPLIKNPPPAAKLPYPAFKKVIEQARKWQVKDISISGSGEPTLDPDIAKMIRLIKRYGMNLNLHTNLAFKSSTIAAISQVDQILITLSAADQESYCRIQSPQNKEMFARVLGNIISLSQIKRKYGKPLICIIFIVHKKNYRQIIPMLKLAQKLKTDRLILRMMDAHEETRGLLLNKKEKQELQKILKEAITYKKPQHNLKEIIDGLGEYGESQYELKKCYAGWFNLFINYCGDVFFCCHNDKLSRIIGNIHKQPLKEIWEGPLAQKARLNDKYRFNLKKEPWKNKCDWCFWAYNNNRIDEYIRQIK